MSEYSLTYLGPARCPSAARKNRDLRGRRGGAKRSPNLALWCGTDGRSGRARLVGRQTQCITCRKEREPYRKERLRELQIENGIKPRPPSSSKFATQSNGRLNGSLPNYNFPKIKFCQSGHAIVGENIYLTNHTILCRICTKISWRLTSKNGNLREATVRRVLLELQEGKVISEIVDTGRLKFFCSANPKLGGRIKALAEKNRVTSFKQKIERNRRAAAPVLFRNYGRDVFQAIRRATASIGEWERGDVMSLMFIAVAENRLNLADADDRVEEFVKVHRRRPRVYGESSLDKPVSFDSSATLLDMLSTESGSWDVNMMASTGRRK